jgi:hypothetical protein
MEWDVVDFRLYVCGMEGASQFKLLVTPLVQSMLVMMMALPVLNWFTDEYVRSGLFAHYAVGFPI